MCSVFVYRYFAVFYKCPDLLIYLSLYLLSIDILHICIWPKIYYENIYSILALFCNHFYSYSLLIKLAFLSMEPPLTERHKDCME